MITCNSFGKGKAYHVGTCPDTAFLTDFVKTVCEEKEIKPLLDVPKGVEVTERRKDGRSYLFVMNHNASAVEFEISEGTDLLTSKELNGATSLDAYGVMILKQ